MKSVKILFLFPCLIFSQLISPIDNDSLNTVHVLFEWEQLSNAVSYQIQVAENDSTGFQNPMADLIDSTLLIIIDEGFLWIYDNLLTSISVDGDTSWSKYFEGINWVQQTDDEGYLIKTNSGNLIKTNKNGNIELTVI